MSMNGGKKKIERFLVRKIDNHEFMGNKSKND
jgi:hypothetical protein